MIVERLFVVLGFAAIASAQMSPLERAQTVGHLTNPAQGTWSPEVASMLRVPSGFGIGVFASRLGNIRMMAVSASGTVYATRRNLGEVVMIRDRDGDGIADENRVVARDLSWINGIYIHEGTIYVVTDKRIYSGPIAPEGEMLNLTAIVQDLPDAGQHPNRTLAVGPDGLLYVTVGSTCNTCRETNPMNATIQRFARDGSSRSTWAEGLRNTIGFGWHPTTGELWAMDMGSDWRGDDTPPDELNRIERSGHYGWPWCYADRQIDRHFSQPPPGQTREEFCGMTKPSVLNYQAHSSPLAMVFQTDARWPATYRNDAFIAMHGSWNRDQPTGYKVVRLRFSEGQPAGFEDFITGWLSADGNTRYGRPTGLAFAADGSMLISDDENGVIYRVAPMSP